MAAVSESIVREYFELHGFFVRQQRKFIPRVQAEDDEIDFLVFNPNFLREGFLDEIHPFVQYTSIRNNIGGVT